MKNDILPSNQSFGFLFAAIFALIAAYAAYRGANGIKVFGWLIAAAMIVLITIAAPNLLTPFNKSWMRLGYAMGIVVSPVVLGVIFFFLITPVALVTRLFGRDELRLKKTKVNSYWIERDPSGPAGDTFDKQF